MSFLNIFAQGVGVGGGGQADQTDGTGSVVGGASSYQAGGGSGVSERIKLKDYQIIELKRLLGETRHQLATISSQHDAEVTHLSQKVHELQSTLDELKATQLKEAAMHKINMRESEEENESLRSQLMSIQRSIMTNEDVEAQFDELVEEIIADAVTTNSQREFHRPGGGSGGSDNRMSEISSPDKEDSKSVLSGGDESSTSLTFDQAVSAPTSSARQIATSTASAHASSSTSPSIMFTGHESVVSLASHGTTQSKMGDARVVARLKRQLSRALQRMETLTNHMAIVKQSADGIIASIRQECEAQLEERARNEVVLLNQLSEMEAKFHSDMAGMEDELQHKEEEMVNLRESSDFYQEALRELEGTVQRLQSELTAQGVSSGGGGTAAGSTGSAHGDEAGAAARSAARDMLKLEESLEAIKKENEMLQKRYKEEVKEKDRMIKWLEEDNYMKDKELKKLQAKAEATGHGDDASTASGRSARSLDLHDISGTGRSSGGSFDIPDMRAQMKNMRMMSTATGLDVIKEEKKAFGGRRTVGKKPWADQIKEGTDAGFVKKMSESWSPEGQLGRKGSAEVLIQQQERLEQVCEE